MMAPSIFGKDSLFDDFFNFPSLPGFMAPPEGRPHGKRPPRPFMKADVKEMDDRYEVEIDLPGFTKEEIRLELSDGYLSVGAEKKEEKEEKDEENVRVIRKERYVGIMRRSFYVGDDVTEEDVKAAFENGVLKLTVKKKEEKAPEKKTIAIEG